MLEPIPQDLKLEVKPEDGSSEPEYDEASKVVRIPLSALEGPENKRRTKLVLFTCNKCGGRTARMVNPIAWANGVVFGQCSHCKVWHVLSAPNKKIFEEVRYKDEAGMQPEEADILGAHPGGRGGAGAGTDAAAGTPDATQGGDKQA
ncbi:hypothetical protein HYH03_012512 [Edaphochlamys debaryana]|uniref:DNL-type domain-containing protein n=1 Tax=Edaphochlamys debaryana TaxID=47281 RepID=A0A835XS36_9CHLO|nr:hypothetical protein HYH03_012512 [Edaphochlamys debaryana]|eukprot:KAG2489076.1 hypothetical protein HYH03_012512 [Edaphochlamys debaryana]